MKKVITKPIVGNEARKAYFFKVVLQLLIGSAYTFGLLNLYFETPLINGVFNLTFGVIFTILFFLRNRHFKLSVTLVGIFFQIFIFGHSYYLLPGKQIETGFGLLTAMLPLFARGYRLWFFFSVNFILYHFVLLSVGYENVFYFLYGFYAIIFVMMNIILKENHQYERELIIQRDKIKRDATALQEADELKTRFFANISHELRTPLTLVLSPIASILKSNELSQKNNTYLQLMQQNGQKLLKRINELLELSRLGAKKLEVMEAPVNIYTLTKQITALYEGAANLKEIELYYINDIDSEITLSIDSLKVEMIISNYLSNAIKFTPQKGSITINITKVENKLQVSVKDTGVGIPKEALPLVFDRFYQVKGDNYQEGTGIGLALCKELAELHHGKTWLESEVGEGSTFFVELPYKEAASSIERTEIITPKIREIEYADLASSDETSELVRPTVLVVEDNRDLREYIELLLTESYKIVTTKNGKEALEWLTKDHPRNPPPSLIISDIMMPEMDGITLLKKIKSSDEFRHIPVIMLTAQQHKDVKIEALRIGVDDYLTKPFQAEELLTRIQNLIKNTQQRIAIDPTIKTDENRLNVSAFDLKWLKEIEEKIVENIDNGDFKLKNLAAEMNVSTRTMQLKIKTITGQTPKKYQRNIQLHHARRLLKSGDIKTISELSYQLGFEDQHYFSMLYKAEFGVTPMEELKSFT